MTQTTDLLDGPEPVETADLHFKLYCKLKVFEPNAKYDGGKCCLLAASQYYGLIFVGTINGFSVIQTKSIKSTISFNEYPRKDIILGYRPSHLSVDFSQKVLAVACSSKSGALLNLYTIASLCSEDVSPMKVVLLKKFIPNVSAEVSEMTWQPNVDSTLMICMSDGSMVSLNPNINSSPIQTLPNTTQAVCFCWSPKGKQMVVGCSNGTLSQYKPDLKIVKTLPAPPLFNGCVTVVSVLWVSNYQFAVTYNDKSNSSSFPVVTIVNAVKNEPVSVINYDDITYSTIFFRQHQIYMYHLSAWNSIFISSANGIEVAVLHTEDNLTWTQWFLGDASRAELPLNVSKQETFPLGFTFDFTSEENIPWGENVLPPMPRLLILSDEGVLCVFNTVNSVTGAPNLCAPPKEQLNDSLFVTKSVTALAANIDPSTSVFSTSSNVEAISTTGVFAPPVSEQAKAFQNSQSILEQSSLGNAKPMNFGCSIFPLRSQNLSQVTISDSGGGGGGIVGNIKNVPVILQQQLQQSQLSQQPHQQQIQQAKPQVPEQSGVTTTSAAGVPPSASPNTSTNITQFTSSPTSTISFRSPIQNTAIVSKPAANKFDANYVVTSPNAMRQPSTIFNTSPVNSFKGKPSSEVNIFMRKPNILQSTPIKSPEIIISSVKPVSTKDKVADAKNEEALPKEKSSESPTSNPPLSAQLPVVDDSIYWNALQEEIDHFNSELQLLAERVGSLNTQVGTTEDKYNLKQSIENLYSFWKELKDTTTSQRNEIHSVVTDLMESFAWLEDAKSRNLQRKNPNFVELKKLEELDPISARHMTEIGHLKYYLENQLKQLTTHLEKEWMNYQDSYRMEVKNRMAVPSLEEVYKAMHFQLKILNKQRTLLEDLKETLSVKKGKNKRLSALITSSAQLMSPAASESGSNRASELSKLADNLLQLKINKSDSLPKIENWDIVKSQLKVITERSKKLTSEKQAILREVLSERDMVRIRPVKTSLESSSFLRSMALEKSIRNSGSAAVHTRSKADETDMKKEVEEKQKEKPIDAKKLPNSVQKLDNNGPSILSAGQLRADVTLEKVEVQDKSAAEKDDPSKNIFVFGGQLSANKSSMPLSNVSVTSKAEEKLEKSPLASLTGVVFSIGKESDAKPKTTSANFNFVPPKTCTSEASKDTFTFGSPGIISQPFAFGTASKASEPSFNNNNKVEMPTFGPDKLNFNFVTSTSTESTTKHQVASAATNVSGCATATGTTFPFTFSFSTAASPAIAAPPKVNFLFGGLQKTTESEGATVTTSESLFKTPMNQSTNNFFSSSTSTFGGAAATGLTSTGGATSAPSFSDSKSTSDSIKSNVFTFNQGSSNKTVPLTAVSVITSKPETESEDVDVVTVDEPKQPFTTSETKVFSASSDVVSADVSPAIKTTEILSQSTPVSSVSSVFSSTSSVAATTSITLVKSTAVASAETVATATTVTAVSSPGSTASTTIFSISPSGPSIFGSASTTTTTTTTSIFGQSPDIVAATKSVTPTTSTISTTNAAIGGTISATTSTISSTSAPPIIFGSANKAISTQAASTATAGNIFGGTTAISPNSSTFGAPSTTLSTPTTFTDTDVTGTTNIFSQLLSDSNRSEGLFGSSSTASTPTTNVFSTTKNIFGGSNADTTVMGETTSSNIFSQRSLVFGQSNTSSDDFDTTFNSNSFFGQNVCSLFGGNTAATSSGQGTFESGSGLDSKPVFGQSLFGQNANVNAFLPGSNSLFKGSKKFYNFQTSTAGTFGSTSPGPFSSTQGSVAQTGFCAGSTFQKPLGGFGSPPVFGSGPSSLPAFGASPTFSGAATFGSQPTFGSRPGVFDSSQGSFTQPQGHSTTFENLANQNTLGFANLAQQNQGQSFGGFASKPAFENKTAFGGSSFSSWRSK